MEPGRSQSGPLTTAVAGSDDALDRLEAEWQSLLAASHRPELMQDFRWLRAWWRHYGAGRSLALATFRDGDTLVGIAPCCRREFRYRLGLRYTRLELMGSDEGVDDGVCSEFLGPIVRKGFERAVAEALGDAACSGRLGAWDECVFDMMDDRSPLVGFLASRFQERGFTPELADIMQAPYLVLPSSWTAFEQTLDKKRRQYFSSQGKKFAEWAGANGYVLHRAHDEPSLQEGFDILIRLHHLRWRDAGEVGAFSSDRFRAFHKDVAPQFLAGDELDLTWLTVAGEPVVAHYSYCSKGRLYFYQSGRTVGLPQGVSPGGFMLILAVQRAIGRGLREFDFLGGDHFYKTRFTKTKRGLVRLRIARSSATETFRTTLVSARRSLRRLGRQSPQS